MEFLKRFDVWVLLLLGGGAGLWVLFDQPVVEGDPVPIEASEAPSAEPVLVIHRCTLEASALGARRSW